MSEEGARVTVATAAVAIPRGFGPPPGTVLFDKYRVESLLGLGGTGVVVKAVELATNGHVAVKLLRDDVEIDADTELRLLREAGAAVRLRSVHAAKIRDVGSYDGQPFMVMELLEGMDLGRLLAANQRLDRTFAVELVFQACDALAEAHGIGIIHRDIKPSNLFVTWLADGTICAKVLDFGISKSPQTAEMLVTQRASVLGTPAYMSPEQMRSASAVDPRTDVWSLGTVLYEMVEGRAAFQAASFPEMCIQVTSEEPPAMVQVPELQAIVSRCLAKEPGARYATVAELANALAPFARDPVNARSRIPRMYRLVGKQAPFVTDQHAAVTPDLDALVDVTPRPVMPATSAAASAARPAGRGQRTMTIAIAVLVTLAVGLAIVFATGLK
jgi:serine/threonine-protein kinase